MIEVANVTKTYRAGRGSPAHLALKEVSFTARRGEIVGLLGPNGAGKSTLLKILTGCLQPDAGTVRVAGIDVVAHPRAAQAHIGYLPQTTPVYPELSVQGYLAMIAALRGIPPGERRARLSDAIYATGLEDRLAQPIDRLGKGCRRQVGLAQAILHRPPLLILDEPSAGLDPPQIVALRHLLPRLAQHSTVLLSTPILTEVEALCPRVLILINGEIKDDVAPRAMQSSSGAILVLNAPVRDVLGKLRQAPGVRSVQPIPSECGYPTYRIGADAESDICPTLYALAGSQQWPLRELRSDGQTLAHLFARLAA